MKTKPHPVCVSDFSQVDGEIEDFADSLEKCSEMHGIPQQAVAGQTAQIGNFIFCIISASTASFSLNWW